MRAPIYLDHNATTPVDPQVVRVVARALKIFGNPSSAHAYGKTAHAAVAEARAEVAALIQALPEEVIFTSGATEANNLAIRGAAFAMASRGRHIVTSVVEHPSVAAPCHWLSEHGFTITTVGVDAHGHVSVQAIVDALRPDTTMISVIHAHNEIGSVQDIAAITAVARRRGILTHTDAAQSAGKIPLSVKDLGVDLLTLAGHKFGAPKGVGALYVRAGTPLVPVLVGAGQERGLRPGTENVPAILGLGETARLARIRLPKLTLRLRARRDLLRRRLTQAIPGLAVNGDPDGGLPNTLNISFPGVTGRDLLAASERDVAASTGSACHAHSSQRDALAAMGLPPERQRGAVRLSLGRSTTVADIEDATAALVKAWAGLA